MNSRLVVLLVILVGCSSAGQTAIPTSPDPTAPVAGTTPPLSVATTPPPSVAISPSTPPPSVAISPSTPPGASPTVTAGPNPTASPATVEPAWRLVDATGGPSARSDQTLTVSADGTSAYLFGGTGADGGSDDLWRLDLQSLAWTREEPAGDRPSPRFGHVAAWVDDVGLVIWSGQNGSDFYNDLWAYDPATAVWTRLPDDGDVPAPRYGSCGAIGPDGRLWISHGFTGTGRFDDTRAYDFSTHRWSEVAISGDRPIKRCLHDCFWAPDGRLLLYGGQTDGVPALGDLWSLDPASGAWTQAAQALPEARQLYAGASSGSTAYVFGGADLDRKPLDSLFTLDLTSLDWAALSPAGPGPSARSGATLLVLPDGMGLLLFGGTGRDGPLADLWVLRLGG